MVILPPPLLGYEMRNRKNIARFYETYVKHVISVQILEVPLIVSRKGASPRKRCVVNGNITKGKQRFLLRVPHQ